MFLLGEFLHSVINHLYIFICIRNAYHRQFRSIDGYPPTLINLVLIISDEFNFGFVPVNMPEAIPTFIFRSPLQENPVRPDKNIMLVFRVEGRRNYLPVFTNLS